MVKTYIIFIIFWIKNIFKKKLNNKQKLKYDRELKSIINEPGLKFNCLK